jgi:hypothetical protein
MLVTSSFGSQKMFKYRDANLEEEYNNEKIECLSRWLGSICWSI